MKFKKNDKVKIIKKTVGENIGNLSFIKINHIYIIDYIKYLTKVPGLIVKFKGLYTIYNFNEDDLYKEEEDFLTENEMEIL